MLVNVDPNDEIISIDPDLGFTVIHKKNTVPNTLQFSPHNHDDIYEIMLFLGGDCEFNVEGNSYKLKAYDITFTRPFELHNIVCISKKAYERIILYIKKDFFSAKGREKYLDIFENRELGTGNIISYDLTDGTERKCINKINEYYSEGARDVAECAVTEFLYIINKTKYVSAGTLAGNERIRDVIIYINNNLSERLLLDDIADRFFINKYYLCKYFKKYTGYTIGQYINFKRILLAQEYHRSGQTLLQASINAGFNSYAHFYKTYVSRMGKSPKEM